MMAPEPVSARPRLSSAQQQAWFLAQLVPDTVAYNFQAQVSIKGALDIAALEDALTALIERHESLRTTFAEQDDVPYQIVHPAWRPQLPIIDLAGAPPAMRDSYGEMLVQAEIRKPIDVANLPLIRWLLIREAADEHRLLHIEHHLIHDGWSFRLFMSELATLYNARKRPRDGAAALAAPMQFVDFCREEGDWLTADEGLAQRAFWGGRLAGWPAYGNSLIPGVAEARKALSFSGSSISMPIPAPVLAALSDLATATRTTLFEAMIAIFAAVVRAHHGSDRIIIGTAIANRDEAAAQSIIGMLVNMLPLRFWGGGSLRDLFSQARDEVRGACHNGRTPVSAMVEDLRPDRVCNALPFIQTAFNFHNSMTRDLDFEGLKVDIHEGLSNGSAKFDLNVIVVFDDEADPRRGGRLLIEFAHDLAPEADIAAFFQDYLSTIAAWAASPDMSLADLRAGTGRAAVGRQDDAAYWRRRLADLGDAPLLGPAYRTRRASGVRARLARPLAAAVSATDLAAAYVLLLARHTASADVLFGYWLDGREQPLPLRISVDETGSFSALAGQVEAAIEAALDHGALPFDAILATVADQDRDVLFQTVLTTAPKAPSTAGLQICLDARDGVVFDYDDGLFDGRAVERLAGHFLRLLGGGRDAPMSAMAMMDEQEAARLQAWSQGPAPAYPERTVHEQFEHWVTATPNATALRSDGRDVSYRALDLDAAKIAAALQKHGVSSGDTVGVVAARSPSLIAALLGILKAGAVYVPMEAEFPAARQQLILTETGARIVLTDAAASVFQPDGVAVLHIGDLLAEPTQPVQPAALSPDAPAYFMFTSGSTGAPKGVHSSHRAIVSLVCGADYVDIAPQDRILGFAPLSFDASTFEIWGALLNGAALVLQSDRAGLDELAETIAVEGVSILWLTTSLFKELVESHPAVVAKVAQVMTGGDVVPVDSVRRLFAQGGDCRLTLAYGPTECTTFSTCQPIPRDAELGDRLSIGRPIAHRDVHILDRLGRPAPVGVAGEIVIGGLGISGAYLNRPELTAERFMASPFKPGDRLFRSGDVGARAEDGTIDFLGRADDQVKIRGFRVEPAEVEAALRQQGGVRDCTVIAHRAQGEKRVVAFVTPQPGAALTEAALRGALRATLPDYMVPARILMLDALPLQTTGKLDRRHLNQLADEAGGTAATPAPAASGLEPLVHQVWAETLGLAAIGPQDDFFALGGHSLAAMRIMSRLSREIGQKLPLSLLFDSPTVGLLANAIDKRRQIQMQPGRRA